MNMYKKTSLLLLLSLPTSPVLALNEWNFDGDDITGDLYDWKANTAKTESSSSNADASTLEKLQKQHIDQAELQKQQEQQILEAKRQEEERVRAQQEEAKKLADKIAKIAALTKDGEELQALLDAKRGEISANDSHISYCSNRMEWIGHVTVASAFTTVGGCAAAITLKVTDAATSYIMASSAVAAVGVVFWALSGYQMSEVQASRFECFKQEKKLASEKAKLEKTLEQTSAQLDELQK